MAEKTVYIIDLDDKAKGKLKLLQGEAKRTDTGFMGLSSTMGTVFGGAAIAGIAAIGKGIFDITAKAEMTKASFEVMLGSQDKAAKMIADIRKFAAETPFETGDLEQAANTLIGFGIQGDRVMGIMKSLGDVSGGNADKFQRLTLAFAQTQAAGKLMGQDLLQYINAGFNPLKIISEQTGLSMAKLKDRMSGGLISAEMVSRAFEIATGKGGQYFNLLERQSQTLSGKLSTLIDNIKMMGLSIGESNIGKLHFFLDLAAASLRNLEPFKDLFAQMFAPVEYMAQLFSGFGGDTDSGVLLLFKTFATLVQAILTPIQLLTAQLFNIFDILKSIATLSFEGLGDRVLERLKNPFKTFSKIWKDEEKKVQTPQEKFKESGLTNNVFDSLKTPTAKEIKKSKGTAGGINLAESRNGATNINITIDTFQKNDFTKSGDKYTDGNVDDFLGKMRVALLTVINDAQIVAAR